MNEQLTGAEVMRGGETFDERANLMRKALGNPAVADFYANICAEYDKIIGEMRAKNVDLRAPKIAQEELKSREEKNALELARLAQDCDDENWVVAGISRGIDNNGEVKILDEENICARAEEMADEILAICGEGYLDILVLLDGAEVFSRILQEKIKKIREGNRPILNARFIHPKSYAGETKSSGKVKIDEDSETTIRTLAEDLVRHREQNTDILIVDDIFDTGKTISEVKKRLEDAILKARFSASPKTHGDQVLERISQKPKGELTHKPQILTAVMLDKPANHSKDLAAEDLPNFVGFAIPSKFVVGMGLDYGEKGRGAKVVAQMATFAGVKIPNNDPTSTSYTVFFEESRTHGSLKSATTQETFETFEEARRAILAARRGGARNPVDAKCGNSMDRQLLNLLRISPLSE